MITATYKFGITFKIGDKVKCTCDEHPFIKKGEIVTISKIGNDGWEKFTTTGNEIEDSIKIFVKELKGYNLINFIYSFHIEKIDMQEQLEFNF
jgi:hypothetical protein